jgi:trehalose-6-phosphate synthase
MTSDYVEFQTEEDREAFLDKIESKGYEFCQHMESYEVFGKGNHAYKVYLDTIN